MKYDIYTFTSKEWVMYVCKFLLISGCIAYLFFDSIFAFLIFTPLFIPFFKYTKKNLIKKRKEILRNQFVQAISSIGTAIVSGYSIESSIIEARNDMEKIYDTDSFIVMELSIMVSQMDLGVRVEKLMDDFAQRSGIQEIKDFSTIFSIARNKGGKYIDIISNCIEMINAKEETEREIQILISGKKYEQKVMDIIPLVLIGILKLASADYIDVLYHNLAGVVIMTICLAVYAGAIILSEIISDIRV